MLLNTAYAWRPVFSFVTRGLKFSPRREYLTHPEIAIPRVAQLHADALEGNGWEKRRHHEGIPVFLSKTRRAAFLHSAPKRPYAADRASDHTPLGLETPQSRRLRRRTIPDRVRPCAGRFIYTELELRQGCQDRRRGTCVRLAIRGLPGQFHKCVEPAPGCVRRRKRGLRPIDQQRRGRRLYPVGQRRSGGAS